MTNEIKAEAFNNDGSLSEIGAEYLLYAIHNMQQDIKDAEKATRHGDNAKARYNMSLAYYGSLDAIEIAKSAGFDGDFLDEAFFGKYIA